MTTALPSNVSYGQVVFRYLAVTGVDAERDPAAVPINGAIVTFTQTTPRWLNATAAPSPVTIVPRPVVCRTDSDGYLIDSQGARGVYLVATNDPDLNPLGSTYQVLIDVPGAPAWTFPIDVFAGQVVDLTVVQPVPGSAGNAVVIGPAGPPGPAGPTGGSSGLTEDPAHPGLYLIGA